MYSLNQVYSIRLNSYKSFRHYGGRDINIFQHIVPATLFSLQDGNLPYVFIINEDIEKDGKIIYKKGHKIAIHEKDIID